jgi:hypothetical protein
MEKALAFWESEWSDMLAFVTQWAVLHSFFPSMAAEEY